MILIVGATGYVGRYLSVTLKEQGKEVLALGRNPKVEEFFESEGVPFQHFDLLCDADYDLLPKEGIEAVINLAICLPEHEVPLERFFEVNTKGNYKLLEFARRNKIAKFIMASTHKVYCDIHAPIITEEMLPNFTGPHSPYIISKLSAEQFMQYYSKDFDMDALVLRFTGIQGYGSLMGYLRRDGCYTRSASEWFIEKAYHGDPIEVFGDMSIRRDHIYIKDAVGSLCAAIAAPVGTKGIYNVASGVAHNQYEDAVAIAKAFATDHGISTVTLHPEKNGLTRGYCYSIEKIRRDMGWSPQYTDLDLLYADYRKEWEAKRFHNYHFIRPEDKPLSFT